MYPGLSGLSATSAVSFWVLGVLPMVEAIYASSLFTVLGVCFPLGFRVITGSRHCFRSIYGKLISIYRIYGFCDSCRVPARRAFARPWAFQTPG
jgi:hypothetical protein